MELSAGIAGKQTVAAAERRGRADSGISQVLSINALRAFHPLLLHSSPLSLKGGTVSHFSINARILRRFAFGNYFLLVSPRITRFAAILTLDRVRIINRKSFEVAENPHLESLLSHIKVVKDRVRGVVHVKHTGGKFLDQSRTSLVMPLMPTAVP